MNLLNWRVKKSGNSESFRNDLLTIQTLYLHSSTIEKFWTSISWKASLLDHMTIHVPKSAIWYWLPIKLEWSKAVISTPSLVWWKQYCHLHRWNPIFFDLIGILHKFRPCLSKQIPKVKSCNPKRENFLPNFDTGMF